MTITDDGKECFNPLHAARVQAREKLKILLESQGIKIEHIYEEDKCSYQAQGFYD